MHPHPEYADWTVRELELRRDQLKDQCYAIESLLFEIDVEIIARGLAQTDARQ